MCTEVDLWYWYYGEILRERIRESTTIDLTSMAVVRLIFEGRARPADVLAWDLDHALWELVRAIQCKTEGALDSQGALDPHLLAWCVDHLVEKFQHQPLVPLQRKNGGIAVARGAWDPCSFRHRYGKV